MLTDQALEDMVKTITFTLLIIWALVQIGGHLFGLYDCATMKIHQKLHAPPR